MKISQQTTTTTTYRGSISETELLAYLRQTLEIPTDANVTFYVDSRGGSETVVDNEDPLRFLISHRAAAEPTPATDIPMRAVVNVPLGTPLPPERLDTVILDGAEAPLG